MMLDVHEPGPPVLDFERSLSLAPLEDGTPEGAAVRRARVCGSVARGRRQLELRADLDATVVLQCCRCLDRYDVVLHSRIELTIVPEPAEPDGPERLAAPDTASLYHAKDGRTDLAPIAIEQLYLALPLKPVCAPDCRGLCPTCGENRNRIKCGCREETADPRLAPLLEFKKRLEGP